MLEYRPNHDVMIAAPEQWTGGRMYKVLEMYCQEMQID